ncbi:SDR family oxidoreductase [Labilibacter marinus]|uniref:SDR family oxidoreductase n=1 Tax=Labilibacter marinus TaxID=1477105 RepID=UPI0008348419|nr:SDR family oxidoreductase [Labilibacter marinus]
MNDNLSKTVSILGCGWLGLALAESLVKKGHNVKGSAHTPEHLEPILNLGAKPYQIGFTPELNKDADISFFESEILISCIPPRRRNDIATYYPQQIEALAKAAITNGVKKIIFISSTSVYPNTQSSVNEENTLPPEKESGKALILAENLLLQNNSFETTVIRFGGLIGYDRHPGRFLAGGKALKNGNVPVNLIHRDDCIGIIESIISKDIWQETFNACAPEHPTRKEFYTLAAQKAGLSEPEFISSTENNYKLIDIQKLKNKLQYQFIYNNPLETI